MSRSESRFRRDVFLLAVLVSAFALILACGQKMNPPPAVPQPPKGAVAAAPPPPPSHPPSPGAKSEDADPLAGMVMANAPADAVEEIKVAAKAAGGFVNLSRADVARLQSLGYVGGSVSGARERDFKTLHDAAGEGFNTESYAAIEEAPFLEAASNPLSTFSIDVDRAAYSNVRRFLRDGQRPPVDAVRIEELLNYFPYDDPAPTGTDPVAVRAELAQAPWNTAHQLLRIGLQARRLDLSDLPPNNLVFLIDVSGSMESPEKLPLLKSAFRLLVNELRDEDRVAIVVYAGSAGLVLPSTPGSDKRAILDALERLEAGGSTAGGEGLILAYDVARRNRIAKGNNRVILATDGDFNIGVSSDAEMFRLVEARRAEGTMLTILGFGTENLKDSKMEGMADRGNGQYAYVDSLLEARKVLVRELGGTLTTVAKDVKLQVEFNPARVAAYRLIGYENRLLRKEDFEDDTKDAGEMGAGHAVTALYEILPAGTRSDVELRRAPRLRYQTEGESVQPTAGATGPRASARAAGAAGAVSGSGTELAFVKIRYKDPEGDGSSRLIEHPVVDGSGALSLDFAFAAAVAEFGMLLRDSKHRGQASVDQILTLARSALGRDEDGYRQDFVQMVESARPILARPTAIASADEPPAP